MQKTGARVAAATLAAFCATGLWPGRLEAADAPSSTSAPVAAKPSFDINEFRVLGNHLLAAVVIERAVYPFLGRNRTIDTVKQAAAALEKAYKDSGYGTVFVDIPPQQVNDGIVRLNVTEGRLEHVRVHGARYFSEQQILAGVPALQPGQTPQLSSLQNQLGGLNARTADRSITPILRAGSEPGTVDVDLVVKDTLPLHGSLQ
jgi:hemolysin activation/secretion protein